MSTPERWYNDAEAAIRRERDRVDVRASTPRKGSLHTESGVPKGHPLVCVLCAAGDHSNHRRLGQAQPEHGPLVDLYHCASYELLSDSSCVCEALS